VIAHAKIKTDKIDAAVLAELYASGLTSCGGDRASTAVPGMAHLCGVSAADHYRRKVEECTREGTRKAVVSRIEKARWPTPMIHRDSSITKQFKLKDQSRDRPYSRLSAGTRSFTNNLDRVPNTRRRRIAAGLRR
jgi:hypothetical protein